MLDARAVLGIVVDTGVGLDPRERVERRDQRQVERVLQPVRDRARQPVVARAGRRPAARVEQRRVGRVDERIDETRAASCLRHRRARPGVDVHDAEAGLDLARPSGCVRVLGARVDVALDAGPRQRGRERAHVDVHPAAVARARLRERRGVHAEHGDAAIGHRSDDVALHDIEPETTQARRSG